MSAFSSEYWSFTRMILRMHPADERRCYVISHWLGECTGWSFISLGPGNTCMHRWSGSCLAYIMACCLFITVKNGRDNVSNHQPHKCLLNRLLRLRSKKTSKLSATGLCAGNSPGTGEFLAQTASNAENVSIWWRHHVCSQVITWNNTSMFCQLNPVEKLCDKAKFGLRYHFLSRKGIKKWRLQTGYHFFSPRCFNSCSAGTEVFLPT